MVLVPGHIDRWAAVRIVDVRVGRLDESHTHSHLGHDPAGIGQSARAIGSVFDHDRLRGDDLASGGECRGMGLHDSRPVLWWRHARWGVSPTFVGRHPALDFYHSRSRPYCLYWDRGALSQQWSGRVSRPCPSSSQCLDRMLPSQSECDGCRGRATMLAAPGDGNAGNGDVVYALQLLEAAGCGCGGLFAMAELEQAIRQGGPCKKRKTSAWRTGAGAGAGCVMQWHESSALPRAALS